MSGTTNYYDENAQQISMHQAGFEHAIQSLDLSLRVPYTAWQLESSLFCTFSVINSNRPLMLQPWS